MNRKLDTDTQVFFYEQEFYVLSNFSAFTLNWQGIRFDTSEAAYHWEKFKTSKENRNTIGEEIRLAPSAHEAFQIAQRNKESVREDWNAHKISIMREILIEKVKQHEYVKRKLIETGNRHLIEDSWRDAFWGWGEDQRGRNVLGELWMEVRSMVNQKII
jgi:ribA/ribD-fused uncharacterized protein